MWLSNFFIVRHVLFVMSLSFFTLCFSTDLEDFIGEKNSKSLKYCWVLVIEKHGYTYWQAVESTRDEGFQTEWEYKQR